MKETTTAPENKQQFKKKFSLWGKNNRHKQWSRESNKIKKKQQQQHDIKEIRQIEMMNSKALFQHSKGSPFQNAFIVFAMFYLNVVAPVFSLSLCSARKLSNSFSVFSARCQFTHQNNKERKEMKREKKSVRYTT